MRTIIFPFSTNKLHQKIIFIQLSNYDYFDINVNNAVSISHHLLNC